MYMYMRIYIYIHTYIYTYICKYILVKRITPNGGRALAFTVPI